VRWGSGASLHAFGSIAGFPRCNNRLLHGSRFPVLIGIPLCLFHFGIAAPSDSKLCRCEQTSIRHRRKLRRRGDLKRPRRSPGSFAPPMAQQHLTAPSLLLYAGIPPLESECEGGSEGLPRSEIDVGGIKTGIGAGRICQWSTASPSKPLASLEARPVVCPCVPAGVSNCN
jgi:hypothetical protein